MVLAAQGDCELIAVLHAHAALMADDSQMVSICHRTLANTTAMAPHHGHVFLAAEPRVRQRPSPRSH